MIGPMIGASRLVRAYRSGRAMYARAFPSRKKTAYSSSRTTRVALYRTRRGARPIRLLPFSTSSHPIVAISHLRARDREHAPLERGLQVREGLADRAYVGEDLFPVTPRVVLELRRKPGQGGAPVQKERVPLVQLRELRLENLDVRDEARIPLLRVPHLSFQALRLQDRRAEGLQRLQLVVRGEGSARSLQLPAEGLELVRDLDPEHVVRGPQVLLAPVAGEAGDVQLDPLQQATVFFDALAQVDHSDSSDVWATASSS